MTLDAVGNVRVAKAILLPAIVRRRLDYNEFYYSIKPVCALFYCNKTRSLRPPFDFNGFAVYLLIIT